MAAGKAATEGGPYGDVLPALLSIDKGRAGLGEIVTYLSSVPDTPLPDMCRSDHSS
jgi:hypothetical protein